MSRVRRLISRLGGALVQRAAEGEYRPGPYHLPVTGGWLSAEAGQYWNWWQNGYDVESRSSQSAMVEACVSAYAQTVAMCPGDHWRANTKGGRDRIINSSLSRVLRKPNYYQSMSDFMLNATRSLYLDGNAYALAVRNDRYEIVELHLMDPRQSTPMVARQTGDVFYRLGGNDVIDYRLGYQLGYEETLVPMRDVLHIRLHSGKRHPRPLLGESPLTAALADLAASSAILDQQIQFYMNQARPSAVLSTDLVLSPEQTAALRDRWNEQAKGLCSGGVPILTAGLKVQPWGQSPKDSELAEVMKLTDQKIALAFRVPLQILGLGGPASSTEMMMQSWIATGLGFALNHIEESFGLLFELRGQPDEYVEFDTAALLRTAFKDRIDALVRGVQGGVMAPNEARNLEGYDSVPHGSEPRVQQQVVPLSAAAAIPAAPPSPGQPSSAAQKITEEKPEPKPEPKPAKDYANDLQREIRNIRSAAERIARRRTA